MILLDLIFVTDITDYIRGEKSVEKFQISVKNLNNLWSFIEIYAVFVLDLCGEKSVWRKNDKYEVWILFPHKWTNADPNIKVLLNFFKIYIMINRRYHPNLQIEF